MWLSIPSFSLIFIINVYLCTIGYTQLASCGRSRQPKQVLLGDLWFCIIRISCFLVYTIGGPLSGTVITPHTAAGGKKQLRGTVQFCGVVIPTHHSFSIFTQTSPTYKLTDIQGIPRIQVWTTNSYWVEILYFDWLFWYYYFDTKNQWLHLSLVFYSVYRYLK